MYSLIFVFFCHSRSTTRSLCRLRVLCGARAWGSQTRVDHPCAYWSECELGRTVPSEAEGGGTSFGFEASPSAISSVSLLKGFSGMLTKKDWEVYTTVCCCMEEWYTMIRTHRPKKEHTVHHWASYRSFWQLFLTEVYMYSKSISSAESLELCHTVGAGGSRREMESFTPPWLFAHWAGTPPFL